ncbi:MAG TPA: transketolase C-terminal domain-containing protein [Bryobacteraceae bacterium]|nr:transketolase C-terminal domain-containing protein [Bryobacteraceae bacterium]
MAVAPKLEFKMGMATREAFGRALAELGHENPNVWAVDADLSKSTMTHLFAKEFPERFVSCGIAEANMVAIAAGLASCGKIPFASSFSCFLLNKGFEQLRVTVAYPGLNVKVVGTHSGISIGEDGPSQMSIEEIGLACSLPGFTVVAPADEIATRALIRLAAATDGPMFIRTGRPKTPVIYDAGQKFEFGKAIRIIDGTDVTLIANGLLVFEALRAAEILDSDGIHARVLDMHTVKPLDCEAVANAAAETGAIVVAEEHLVDAGLGVRVAQAAALSTPCPIEFVGLTGYAESGSPDALLDKYGMRAVNIVAAARKAVNRKR